MNVLNQIRPNDIMFRSLRKGRSSIYFQHEHTGHTIGADQFSCTVVGTDGVLQVRLRPAGSNEHQDAQYTLEHSIQYMEISDVHVIGELSHYVRSLRKTIGSWSVEVLTDRGVIKFPVRLERADEFTLRLTVVP